MTHGSYPTSSARSGTAVEDANGNPSSVVSPVRTDQRAISQSNRLRIVQAEHALRYGLEEPRVQPIGLKLIYISSMLGVIGIVGTIATATIIQWMH